LTSVLSEALLSNFQEKILKNFGTMQAEMVRWLTPLRPREALVAVWQC
jgi:hypothetical protein